MSKNKFIADYQINASKKIVFQYISTPSGLEQWFADEVKVNEDKNFIINFDDEDHYATQTAIRLNSHVKFEFYDPAIPEEVDNNYVEFKLEENELTQTLFLKITDYSDGYDEEELTAIWGGLIGRLKEIIGG